MLVDCIEYYDSIAKDRISVTATKQGYRYSGKSEVRVKSEDGESGGML